MSKYLEVFFACTHNFNILIAGFGGQGVLFAGKVLAYCGLLDEKYI